MKARKILKTVILTIISLIVLIIIGLIVNNRICYKVYSSKDTTSNSLSESEKEAVREVYEYLNENGESIFKGFDGRNIDLIVYNKKYEFLFSSKKEENGWEFIEYDESVSRNILRKEAENSEAFAVKVGDRWVGSFGTFATYNKGIIDIIPILFPPQIFFVDKEYYRGLFIHEMAHAFQGIIDYKRVDTDEHLHDICAKYYGNSQFQELFKLEGHYLEAAINADSDKDIITNAKLFLETRQERRIKCGMSEEEISNEIEFEWLEGLGRYAEYYASQGSSKMIVKNLLTIEKKVTTDHDDRYYVAGMAQAMVLDKISDDWQKKVFQEGSTLEECIKSNIDK